MIIVTNGKEEKVLNKIDFEKRNGDYIYFSKHSYWDTELDFVYENGILTKIRKCYVSSNGSGDVIKEYNNKIYSTERILLSDDDYNEISRQLVKFNKDDNNRKKAFVESSSELLAYECYLNYELEELEEVKLKNIFKEYIVAYSMYGEELKSYREEIYNKAKEKLNKKYKVDLDYVFNGGSKDE